MTDNLSPRQEKKFLKFLDELSNYPPMTYLKYDWSNHKIPRNCFPREYYQLQDVNYRYYDWFTLAVLNNFEFMLKVFKQRDPDAIKLFSSIVNSRYFKTLATRYFDFNRLISKRKINFNCKFYNFNLTKRTFTRLKQFNVIIPDNIQTIACYDKVIFELKRKHRR